MALPKRETWSKRSFQTTHDAGFIYNPLGFLDALSYYDFSPLRNTLLVLANFLSA